MLIAVFVTFVDLFVTMFSFLIIVRVVGSYIARPEGRFMAGMANLTEPILGPVRKAIPMTPGLDLAPLVSLLLLQGLQYLVHWMLGA
jgi:YggT family protein